MNSILQTQDGEPVFFAEEPLKWKLLRNWFWLYFFWFLAAPAGYLIKILIAREISVEEIWILYSVLSIIGIISTYNDLWLTEALQYYLPHYLIDKKYNEAKTIIVFTWIMQFVSGILIGSILFFAAPYIADTYFHSPIATTILRLFCIYFLVNNLFQVLQSIFIATQKVKRSQWMEVVRVWTIVLWTTLLLTANYLTLKSFTFAWIGWLFAAIMVWYIGISMHFWKNILKSKIQLHKDTLLKQRKYGFWVMLWIGAWMLFWQINQLLAQYRLWSKVSWYRSYYLSFYSILYVFTWPLINYLFPLLNELYKKKSYDKVKYLYSLLIRGVIGFSLVASIWAYFFAEPVAILLFWEQFAYVWTMFKHFTPFIFTIPLIGILYQDIASRGFVKERFYSIILALAFNILASWWFVKSYQAIWLVYWQAVGNLILVMVGIYYYKKFNPQNSSL